jgi:hypothetical protein
LRLNRKANKKITKKEENELPHIIKTILVRKGLIRFFT